MMLANGVTDGLRADRVYKFGFLRRSQRAEQVRAASRCRLSAVEAAPHRANEL
jgi:hypothetical protein